MPFFSNTEQNIECTKRTLEKLIQEAERLEQETANIFNQMGITEQQFENYIENSANFNMSDWEKLKNHQASLENKLNLLKDQSVDAAKVTKKRSEMYMSQHWLPVR